MRINMAHVRERASGGGWIDFAVFDAQSTNGSNDALLAQLTYSARNSGLKVDQAALAYRSGGNIRFYGAKHLVDYLARMGLPQWTHTIDA